MYISPMDLYTSVVVLLTANSDQKAKGVAERAPIRVFEMIRII